MPRRAATMKRNANKHRAVTRSMTKATKAKRQAAAAKARATLRNMRAASHLPVTRAAASAKKAAKAAAKRLSAVFE
uniref:Uncharacterized protein n=1 Tax=viral metagenome TaxID=1070528 RepID=A0A6C0DS65_9ZZZZ